MNLELSFTMRVARIFEKREGLGTLLKCNSVCGHRGNWLTALMGLFEGALTGATRAMRVYVLESDGSDSNPGSDIY